MMSIAQHPGTFITSFITIFRLFGYDLTCYFYKITTTLSLIVSTFILTRLTENKARLKVSHHDGKVHQTSKQTPESYCGQST